MIQSGIKSEAELVGTQIPYVVCLSEDTKLAPAKRSYHADEFLAKQHVLKPDIKWYITQ